MKLNSASLFAALALALVLPSTAAVPPAEKLLPADTLVVLTIPDWDATAAAAKDIPLARFWRDPAMKPFVEKIEQKLGELIGKEDKNFGRDWAEFKPLVGGQITLAVLRGDWQGEPGSEPEFVAFLDVKDKAKQLKDFIEKCEKRDVEAGKTIQRETVRGVKFARTAQKDAGDDAPKKKQPYVGQSGSLLLISESPKALEKILARQDGAGTGLDEKPEFERARSTVGRDAHAFAWVNIKAFTGVLAKLPAPQGDGNPLGVAPARIVDALGFGGLDGIVMAARQAPEGTQVELFIQAPQARRKGLVSMLTPEAKDAGPLPTVSGDVSKFTRIRIDGGKMFAAIERMVTDINPQMAGIVALMIENVGKDKDPNFDLRKQIFGNLGTDFVTIQKAPRGADVADLASPPTLFLIGSPKPEALLQALLTVNPLPPKEREFLGRKIYSLSGIPGVPVGGGRGQVSFSTAGGYLAISTDAGMLEEAVRGEASGKPLRDVPGLAEAAQKVGGFSTGWFAYENQSETLRLLMDSLRKDPGALEKLFTSPLPGAAAPTAAFQPLKDVVDFSLLPPFEAVGKYFGYTVQTTAGTPDGISFKAYIPVPAGLKK